MLHTNRKLFLPTHIHSLNKLYPYISSKQLTCHVEFYFETMHTIFRNSTIFLMNWWSFTIEDDWSYFIQYRFLGLATLPKGFDINFHKFQVDWSQILWFMKLWAEGFQNLDNKIGHKIYNLAFLRLHTINLRGNWNSKKSILFLLIKQPTKARWAQFFQPQRC